MSQTLTAIGTTGYLVDGKVSTEGRLVEIRSPYDQKVVGVVAFAGPRQLEVAIAAAVRSFDATRKLPAFERQRVLQEVAGQIRSRQEQFARSILQEAGKPIVAARAEVERAVLTFNIAAEEATRIGGEYLPLDVAAVAEGRWGMVRRFPLGPIAAVTPFNFPLNLVAHKIAPAIAAGCAMVLKPAPQTPLTALLLAEIVHNAGWPAGALNVLPLNNEDAGLLVRDERLRMLTFTGSAAVGWQLKSQAGKKRVTLELGGNAVVIVHSDADLDQAAERCVIGGFSYAGQSCIAVQRILVERSVYGEFLEKFLTRVRALESGDPMDEAVTIGPLIREQDAVRAEQWVKDAVSGGAKLLIGGHRKGSLMEATVLTNTRREMRVNCEEVFAPVKTVEAYDDFAEALDGVNASPYGLQAGLFTRDAALIFRAYEELQVGGLVVGDVPTFRVDHMPYGGVKDSGVGREGLRYAIEEMTEPKLLVMNFK
jgi:acyl-CoA reductase-like NAD-dependent aldehyde dehydrogenase